MFAKGYRAMREIRPEITRGRSATTLLTALFGLIVVFSPALYAAKNGGRNRVVFFSEMQRRTRREVS